MKPKARTLSAKKPALHFPGDERESSAAWRRHTETGGRFWLEAQVETPLGPFSVIAESGRNTIITVNNQALRPEHYGLRVDAYVLVSINGKDVEGWADLVRSRG